MRENSQPGTLAPFLALHGLTGGRGLPAGRNSIGHPARFLKPHRLRVDLPLMIPDVDFDSLNAVSAFVRAKFSAMYPGASETWLVRLFGDIDALFAGRNPSY